MQYPDVEIFRVRPYGIIDLIIVGDLVGILHVVLIYHIEQILIGILQRTAVLVHYLLKFRLAELPADNIKIEKYHARVEIIMLGSNAQLFLDRRYLGGVVGEVPAHYYRLIVKALEVEVRYVFQDNDIGIYPQRALYVLRQKLVRKDPVIHLNAEPALRFKRVEHRLGLNFHNAELYRCASSGTPLHSHSRR